ncbi:MAG TPA: TspO/MBR family protein [Rhizomicrobium sp.]|jgi:tryptophan-rich sensory protein|nr:TspO/MBR family protein [Rhizomicrobium sp.]
MNMKNLISLIVFLAICLGIAAVAGLVTVANIPTWYAGLAKPSFTPPNAIIGPVWTLLYILIAISGWMVWRKIGFSPDRPMAIYGLQLALNFAWSFIFFGAHLVGLAVVNVLLLWLVIVWNIAMFWRVDRVAAALLLPYLAWVSFASALNVAVWQLN